MDATRQYSAWTLLGNRHSSAWTTQSLTSWSIYCHEALHMKNKLQKASYSQAVEKWVSDSDSDESDEEEDLKV